MAVTATLSMGLIARDTLAAALDLASNPVITHELTVADRSTLNASSTPAVTAAWSDTVALSGGSATIDLSSLSLGATLTALDLTGLKVQGFVFQSKAANTDTVTIVDGASNGYNLFGDSSGQVTLSPGGAVSFYAPEDLPDVGSGAKTIDLSSSDLDAQVDVILIAG